MDCHYINLDSAQQRRAALEASFERHRKPGWNLIRYPAIDREFVRRQKIAGGRSEAEKGCFLSHKKVIGANADDGRTILVLEDDAVFGAQTCSVVDDILQRNPGLKWDVLFTDLCTPTAATMLDLIKLRQTLAAKNEFTLMDLSKMTQFAGATAYIVNGASKRKLHGLLDAAKEIEVPYDLALRKLILDGAVKGFALFPFVTSLSQASAASQIQAAEANAGALVWNLYRRMIWAGRDLEACRAELEQVRLRLCDEEAEAFGVLFSAMASAKYRTL